MPTTTMQWSETNHSVVRIFIVQKMRFLCPDNALLDKSPCYICFGRLFQFIRNAVPYHLEPRSNLAGIGFQLNCNKARC